MSNAPTLINLPPPPSDPMTPSDMGPGTPNSATTSMSELSTVAIKDGHRGHLPHGHNPMDAERADRISRLAGLERVAQARTPSNPNPNIGGPASQPPPGYFDANNQPQILRERSTVGSASATGSVGGHTTWASGSDVYDPEKMSEDQDQEAENSSAGGFSDEAASLVGFGEGARTPATRQQSGYLPPGSPVLGKTGVAPSHLREQQGAANPVTGVSAVSAQAAPASATDARMIDGMTYDSGVVDTVARTPPPVTTDFGTTGSGLTATETAERIMRENTRDNAPADGGAMGSPEERRDGGKGLGKFFFEGKQ